MSNQHFRTNEELGALYSVEDLLRVKLSGDDLTSFIHNWDAVIAGMSHVPEEITLRGIFLRGLRKSTKMKHDLETYERAKDVTKEHTYHWLIQSVRDLLNRERTHKNRQQIARAHGDKFGAPAPNIPRRPEEDQVLGKSRTPSGSRSPSPGKKGFGMTSSAGSAIGETSVSTSTGLDRHRRNHERSTSPACFGRRASATKGTSACSGLKQQFERGLFNMIKVGTDEQVADIFAKPFADKTSGAKHLLSSTMLTAASKRLTAKLARADAN